jgi:hypothetical protein
MSKNIFVFVVCGTREHIDTMNLSMQYLKKYSKHEVYVLTDSSRNEINIIHPHIIDIKTPVNLNHHQASIYLKTGIHKFLPKGNNYCYIDTDVIALSETCDHIFNEYIEPIRFAPDHCSMRKFSAYAVNCNCLSSREKDRATFLKFVNEVESSTVTNPLMIEKARELQFEFDRLKSSLLKRGFTAMRYFLSYPIFKFNQEFHFNKRTRTWHYHPGEVVMYEMNIKKLEQSTGLHYNKWNQKWYNKSDEDIWQDECNHLREHIKHTFNIEITDNNWQHWNGGVFLFNDQSHSFLDAWHEKSIRIFTLPQWKTRDQGTLIATVWEFGLQNHPLLNKKWNFIADYYNKGLTLNTTENLISDDGFNTSYQPALLHVYHNWGKTDWNVWQWVESKL